MEENLYLDGMKRLKSYYKKKSFYNWAQDIILGGLIGITLASFGNKSSKEIILKNIADKSSPVLEYFQSNEYKTIENKANLKDVTWEVPLCLLLASGACVAGMKNIKIDNKISKLEKELGIREE